MPVRADLTDLHADLDLLGPFWTGMLDAGPVELENLFDAWVFAAWDAALALDAWRESSREHRGDAFAVYRAALDREEHAAVLLSVATGPQVS
jgi:hypothetical protein